MEVITEFSAAVCEKLGNYVYRLIDPRNGETFYVGRGMGNRVFAHVNLALSFSDDEDELGAKVDRIRDIRNAGLEVIHVIHRHEISDAAVADVEAAVIDAYPGLTNIQGGAGSGSKGPMNAVQIVDKYALPEMEFEPPEKLVLINVNALQDVFDRSKIYFQVRFAWRISQWRASQADYVLAVMRGVVVGAFVADEWLPVTSANFPKHPVADVHKGRWGFVGHEAPPDVWKRFVGERGKRITNENMKHVQNPVRYWRV
jgi:hypothetical protein